MEINQKMEKFRMRWGRLTAVPQGKKPGRTRDAMRIILMANDNPDEYYLIKDALGEIGLSAELRLVSDGTELMDYLMRRGRFEEEHAPLPSLILMDLDTPGTPGRNTLSDLKSNPELKQIPVIITTGSREPEHARQCCSSGADSYISKPHSFEALVETLAALLPIFLPPAPTPRA